MASTDFENDLVINELTENQLHNMEAAGTIPPNQAFFTNDDGDDLDKKADKVEGATLNNLASLDANGNLKDSGTSKASLEATMNTKIATTSSMTITSVGSSFSVANIIITKNNNIVTIKVLQLKPKIAIGTWQWTGMWVCNLPQGYRPKAETCFVLSFDASPENGIMRGIISTSGSFSVNTHGYTKALAAGQDRSLYGSVTYVV